MSASVNLPLHHKVQKFSSGTSSPGWSRRKGRKTVVCVVCVCVWNSTQAAERAEKCHFLFLVTLTFDFDLQTGPRLPCEFGTYLFSGSRDISYTNKKVTDSVKNRTLCSSLYVVETKRIITDLVQVLVHEGSIEEDRECIVGRICEMGGF